MTPDYRETVEKLRTMERRLLNALAAERASRYHSELLRRDIECSECRARSLGGAKGETTDGTKWKKGLCLTCLQPCDPKFPRCDGCMAAPPLAQASEPIVNSESFTDQKPRIAVEADKAMGGGKDGARFRCYLCGHRFKVGDVWRWVYFVREGCTNFLTCQSCDGPDVVERWRAANQELRKRFWWSYEER